jgi:hypothetical protein
MAQNKVLRWMDGRGWLVLVGGHEAGSAVRAQALGRASADGGVAYVTLGGESELGEKALADMEDLGAPSGYLVDILSEDDQTIASKLGDAGMVVIEAVGDVDDLRASLLGAAMSGMQAAFQNGAVILAEGSSATVFGAWVLADSGLTGGLEWVENALVMPGITSLAQSDAARNAMAVQPAAIAIGIGGGSALALGPDGEVETWGNQQVTLTLGANYRA